jgi:hypothetical protein
MAGKKTRTDAELEARWERERAEFRALLDRREERLRLDRERELRRRERLRRLTFGLAGR